MIHDIKNPPAKAEAKPEPFDVEATLKYADACDADFRPEPARQVRAACDEIEKLQAEVLSNMLVRKDLFDTVQELRAEIEKLRARSIDDTNLHLYNDLELSRLEIAKLQKRAEDWEQKDVVAFEKTIADLREKLAAVGSRVYGSRRHWKGRAGRAERELESYAATDRTASIALVDVTRERDEARERLAAAETLAEQRRVEVKVHKQFTKQYNAAVERERDEARVSLASYIEANQHNEKKRDDLQRQLDDVCRNGIPGEWSAEIAKQRFEARAHAIDMETEVERLKNELEKRPKAYRPFAEPDED